MASRLLAISGSLRADSHNARLLRAAGALAPAGVEFVTFGGLREIPPFDQDLETGPAPAAVAELRDAIAQAAAVLVATPEYNHSIPGQLKNALDWVSRPHATNPLRDVPVAVIGASASMFGAVWAQAEARKVLGAIGARVVDDEQLEVAVGMAADAFAPDGSLVEPELQQRLAATLEALLAQVREGELAAA